MGRMEVQKKMTQKIWIVKRRLFSSAPWRGRRGKRNGYRIKRLFGITKRRRRGHRIRRLFGNTKRRRRGETEDRELGPGGVHANGSAEENDAENMDSETEDYLALPRGEEEEENEMDTESEEYTH